jgi:hypothetical protein
MLAARTFPVPGRPPGKCSTCEGTGNVTKIPKKGKGRLSLVGDACPKCGGSGDAPFGGNWRNYSHLYEEGWNAPALPDGTVIAGYANASKGEKPLIVDFLRRDHRGLWFAAIADSGQKHVVHHCPPNLLGPGGTVLFEEELVAVPPGLALVDDMARFLTDGATKDEISSGNYTQFCWVRMEQKIREFEERNANERHSGWFRLALWLAQRDEAAVAARIEAEKASAAERKRELKTKPKEERSAEPRAKKNARDATGRDAVGNPGPVRKGPGRKGKAGLHGADPEPSADKRGDVPNNQQMGERVANRSADAKHRHVGQLGLFDAS